MCHIRIVSMGTNNEFQCNKLFVKYLKQLNYCHFFVGQMLTNIFTEKTNSKKNVKTLTYYLTWWYNFHEYPSSFSVKTLCNISILKICEDYACWNSLHFVKILQAKIHNENSSNFAQMYANAMIW